MNIHEELAEIVTALRRERDAIHLKLHLLKAEARDEWHALEGKWNHLQQKAAGLGDATGEAAGDVAAAARLLGEELARGYHRIRDSLK